MTFRYASKYPWLRTTITVFLLVVLAMLAYANTFQGPFVFDDQPNITRNPAIRLTRISPEGLARVFNISYRPLANLSFALNYYVHGYDVRGYHIVNLAVHIMTALLVWLVARQILNLGRFKKDELMPALAAALWLVNPLHTQSVTYIVQRMNALAALFYLLCLAAYIQARTTDKAGRRHRLKKILHYGLCLSAGVFGLASKQIVATLPLMFLIYEWFFFQNLDRAWLKRRAGWIAAVAGLILVFALIYMKGNPVEKLISLYAKQDFTPGQRLLTEARVVIYYISLLLFPHPARLIVDYDFPLSTGFLSPPTTLLSLTALVALLIAALYAAGRHRLPAFAILWFLVTLAVESSIIGLYLIYEHRTYLPSTVPTIALVWLVCAHLRPRPLAVGVLIIIIAFGAVWTYQRNRIWQTDLALWQDNAAKAPKKARPANGVGVAYQLRNQPEKALTWFKKAVHSEPTYYEAYNNIGGILIESGKYAEALPYIDQSIDLNPDNYEAYNNLGSAMHRLNRLDDAVTYFLHALALFPEYETAHNNLGAVLVEKGDIAGAVRHLRQALRINPAYPEPYNNLGLAMMRQEHIPEAIRYYRQALDLNPEYTTAHFNLGTACFQNRDLACAADHLRQAARLDPGSVLTLNNLTSVLVLQEKYQEAGGYLIRLAELMPDSPTVYYNLACVYALQNRKDEAVNFLRQAVAKGYDRWEHLKNDPDLQNIRDTEYFHQLTQSYGITAKWVTLPEP